MGDILCFGMLDFVEVFVHDILVYMVQKYLVGKMDNFHSDLMRDVDSHENLLNLLMYLENFIFVKINDFAYLFGEDELFVMDLHNYNCVLQNYFL